MDREDTYLIEFVSITGLLVASLAILGWTIYRLKEIKKINQKLSNKVSFIREKSVIEDNLAKTFPNIKFLESDPQLDHAGDIDYLGWVGDKAFGIQIKPVTAKANFGNYSATERMKASFEAFKKKFGGNVFIIFSIDDKIKNENVVELIADEIKRLTN